MEKYFFELPPSVMSYLRPKLRLFKVENKKDSNGQLVETEFIFPQHADINRRKDYKKPQPGSLEIAPFLQSQFDKGDGCGVKEFSFEFNGTNPAEARNDIKATLKLYFQTFTDFLRARVSRNGKEYRFVDLIIQPDKEDGKVNGVNVIHKNQYDPSFYRIRAEVGYYYPDNINTFTNLGFDSEDLKSAIARTNKSFFLCMVDHDLSVDVEKIVTGKQSLNL